MEAISRPLGLSEAENRKALRASKERLRHAEYTKGADIRISKAEAKRARRRARNLTAVR